jgi:hypothetical protein
MATVRPSHRSRCWLPVACAVALISTVFSIEMGNPQAQESADPIARVVRRFPAEEASQAVAVDDRYFYAIASAAIGKYDKATGRAVLKWVGEPQGRIAHLNSGVVLRGELYCAHSNYPHIPMESSIEAFDTKTMTHLRSMPLPAGHGSATWVDYGDGAWWVTFAHYSGRGGEPGKGSEATRLVRFTNDWRPAGEWTFPQPIVARWGEMSSSGGTLASRGLFYTTGHDSPELYVLKRPGTGQALTLAQIVRVESEGQGLALDRREHRLYTIQRRTHEVLVSVLPRVRD